MKSKKDIVLEKRSFKTVIISVFVVSAIIFTAVTVVLLSSNKKSAILPLPGLSLMHHKSVSSENGIITFEVSSFDNMRAGYYKYDFENGKTVRFFILKSTDSAIKSAFDACDVCYRAGKGYIQSGNNMICVNCSQQFSSENIGRIRGGCNPAPLSNITKDGKVIIKTSDLYDGIKYFNF